MDTQKKMGEVAALDPISVVYDLERQSVVDLMIEVVANADIINTMSDGTTLYVLHLSATAADTLAALFADLEGDELDAGELDPLDAGEDEHDGREPEDEGDELDAGELDND